MSNIKFKKRRENKFKERFARDISHQKKNESREREVSEAIDKQLAKECSLTNIITI
jgi:hypothetical protein